MSFKLHIFTHDQDNVQIPSIVSIIVYNMYLEASEMCVWGVTTSLRSGGIAPQTCIFTVIYCLLTSDLIIFIL